MSGQAGSGSYRFRFNPVPIHADFQLTEPGSTVPGSVHKIHEWIISVDNIHGEYPRLLSMIFIHGYYPGNLSMEIIYG